MSYSRQISRAVVLRRGIEKIQKLLPMERPESPHSLALCLLAKFVNGELLSAKCLGKLGKCQQLNELLAFHNIVLFDATTLGELFEVHEGQSREGCNGIHGNWMRVQ
jgi:hypothetical protein